MMNNLFSSFNPEVYPDLPLNWLSAALILIFLPSKFWLITSKFSILFLMILSIMIKELNIILLKKNNKKNLILFMSLFLFILFNNFLSLFPFIFSASSHMVFSTTLALMIFLPLMIFGWTCVFSKMCTHLVPQGSPGILIPFMVLIELTSSLIRPLTLSIRLTANLIAGHLLITLISSSMTLKMMIPTMLAQTTLMILELCVSIIQAYVFTILSTLYSKEIYYE
uniref:ATP synthase subunit a n=1 Tax=Prosevania sp. ZJUH_2016031 TaxID=2491170 RepID=A0A3S8V183_9HYME|nr:ATP synthase F0 subunit 6 [Prosevania sp. ZJUH_2016031]